jgi:hypothetical protein
MIRNLSAIDASAIFRILIGDAEAKSRASQFQLSDARNGNYIRTGDFAHFLTRNQIELSGYTVQEIPEEIHG